MSSSSSSDDEQDVAATQKRIALIAENDPRIVCLDLGGFYECCDETMDQLAACLRSNTYLLAVQLIEPGDTSSGSAVRLGEAIAKSKSIRQMWIEGFETKSFCNDLLLGVSLSKTLRELHVSTTLSNCVTGLCKLVSETKKLEILGVNFVGRECLDVRDAFSLVRAFQDNKTLQSVELIGSDFTAFEAILRGLRGHVALQKCKLMFDLQQYSPSSDDSSDLIKALQDFGKYTNLDEIEAIESFQEVLPCFRNVKKLILGDKSSTTLASYEWTRRVLSRMPAIEHLVFAAHMHSQDLQVLLPVLRRLSNLRSIELALLVVSASSHEEFVRDLVVQNPGLESVKISFRYATQGIDSHPMFAGLVNNSNIKEVSFTGLKRAQVQEMVTSCRHADTNLEKLRLGSKQLDSHLITGLFEMPNPLFKLQDLDFSGFAPGRDALLALCSVLRGHDGNCQVSRLNLQNSLVDDEVAATLFSALEENEFLREVNLQTNALGVPALLALADSLPNMRYLRRLLFSVDSSDTELVPVIPRMLEGFRRNRSIVFTKITSFQFYKKLPAGKWCETLAYYNQRNGVRPFLKVDGQDDSMSSLRPQVLFWLSRLNRESVSFEVMRKRLSGWIDSSKGVRKRDMQEADVWSSDDHAKSSSDEMSEPSAANGSMSVSSS